MPKQRRSKLTKLLINEISLVDEGANGGARVAFFKRRGSTSEPGQPPHRGRHGGDVSDHKEVEDMNIEELAKALEAAEAQIEEITKNLEDVTAERDAHKEEVEKLKAEAGAEGEGDGAGEEPDMPEEVRKALDDAKAREEELRSQIEKMRDKEVTAEYVTKAKGFQHLPIKAEDFGPVLKRVALGEPTEDDMKELDRVLKAADASIGKAMTELGAGREANADGAQAELNKLAEERAKADNITVEKAATLVLADNPELYERVLRGE